MILLFILTSVFLYTVGGCPRCDFLQEKYMGHRDTVAEILNNIYMPLKQEGNEYLFDTNYMQGKIMARLQDDISIHSIYSSLYKPILFIGVSTFNKFLSPEINMKLGLFYNNKWQINEELSITLRIKNCNAYVIDNNRSSLENIDYLNAWVDNHTKHAIPELFASTSAVDIALISTGYFKAKWPNQLFMENQRTWGIFETACNKNTGVYFIEGKSMVPYIKFTIPYINELFFEAIALHFGDNQEYSLIIILPYNMTDCTSFENVRDALYDQYENVITWLTNNDTNKFVNYKIPLLKHQYTYTKDFQPAFQKNVFNRLIKLPSEVAVSGIARANVLEINEKGILLSTSNAVAQHFKTSNIPGTRNFERYKQSIEKLSEGTEASSIANASLLNKNSKVDHDKSEIEFYVNKLFIFFLYHRITEEIFYYSIILDVFPRNENSNNEENSKDEKNSNNEENSKKEENSNKEKNDYSHYLSLIYYLLVLIIILLGILKLIIFYCEGVVCTLLEDILI